MKGLSYFLRLYAALLSAAAGCFAYAAPAETRAAAPSPAPAAQAAPAPLRPEASALLKEADPSLLVTSPKMRRESALLVNFIENGHYLRMPLSELDIRELLREYMSSLDFLHMFFLADDVQYYQDAFSPALANLLRQGIILPANKIYHETFVPRVNARLDWIRARMEKPFDFSSPETFAPDRSKSQWPKDAAEADDLWEKRLKYDILNQMIGYDHAENQLAAEIDDDAAKIVREEERAEKLEKLKDAPKTYEEKLEKAKAEVLKRYESLISNIVQNDAIEIQELFLNSLANLYDPHSAFLSEYALEEFKISIENKLFGIGAVLQDKDGYCTVAEIMPGSPAEKSKALHPGDKIVGVGQETGDIVDVVGKKLRSTVRLIRGKEGTKLRLEVEPKDNPGVRSVITLTREEVELTQKLAKAYVYEIPVGASAVPVGVIDIPAFYGEEDGTNGFSTSKDVEELIEKLKARGVKGIILDMRKNGGGFLDEAVDLAGLFIRTGPVLQVRGTMNNVEQRRDDNPKVAWNGPLVVLVSRLSASAAEIVAGALQNHERAIIIGDDSTYGKGTVQGLYKLSVLDKSQNSAAKITVQKWYLPNGDSIQIRGIKSDIPLPSLLESVELGEDKKDHALEWDAIDPASIRAGYGYGEGEKGQELLKSLSEKSLVRQKELDEFKFLNERIDWLKNRRDMKDWSLDYKARERQLHEDEKFFDSMKARQKELAKGNFKSEEVLLDSAIEKEKNSPKASSGEGGAESGAASAGEPAEPDEKAPAKDGGKAPEGDGETDGDDDDVPEFDVQLREALRVMGDWLALKGEGAAK